MTIIEYAEHRLKEELNVKDGDWNYWRGYIDGAKAQKKEDERNRKVDLDGEVDD